MKKKALVAFAAALAALVTPHLTHAQTYFRVETGYSQSFDADFGDKNFGADHVICGNQTCTTRGSFDDVGSSVILSAGVGRHFTRNLRGEINLAYRPGYQVDGMDKFITPGHYTADVKSWSLMASGYYDFHLRGWIPYLGAGIGVARNTVGTFTFHDNAGFSGSAASKTTAGVAWALMAGVGIPLSPRYTIEVGYRYIDLGKIETGPGSQTFLGTTTPYEGAQGRLKANELTLALRF